MDDPDAPDPEAPQLTWTHWIVFDIPPTTKGFEEGIIEIPNGSKVGENDWKKKSYGGPCPPIGRHRYYFKLYALDQKIGHLKPKTKLEFEKAIEGKVIAKAELIGTYKMKLKR